MPTTTQQDPAFALADHVARTQWSDLPESAINATQRDITDTFGCMLGGTAAPGIDDMFALYDDWGGRPEARVMLRGRSLPAPAAAMMNAAMGHALDFDDTHDTAGSIHPGVSVLATGLAMADRIGVINKGELVLVEDKDVLMRKLGKKQLTLQLREPLTALPAALAGEALELSADGTQLVFSFDAQAEETGIAGLLRRLGEAGVDFKDLRTEESSLEEIFVNLVRAQ